MSKTSDRLEKRLEKARAEAKKAQGTVVEQRAARKLVKRLARKIARTKKSYANAARSRKSTGGDS